jgi:hypothetical protein
MCDPYRKTTAGAERLGPANLAFGVQTELRYRGFGICGPYFQLNLTANGRANRRIYVGAIHCKITGYSFGNVPFPFFVAPGEHCRILQWITFTTASSVNRDCFHAESLDLIWRPEEGPLVRE